MPVYQYVIQSNQLVLNALMKDQHNVLWASSPLIATKLGDIFSATLLNGCAADIKIVELLVE